MIVGRSTSVTFESGMLLSKEMLVQLEHLTHLNEIQYSAYPDGIIYGLELREEDGKPFFTPGLVKAEGDCYYIEAPIDIFELLDAADKNRESGTVRSAIVLTPCGTESVNEGICSKRLCVSLVNQSDAKDTIRLAEFQYSNGNRKFDFTADLETQLNTTGVSFSFLTVGYSLPYETVFSPYIYKLMRSRLEALVSPSIEDAVLLFTLCQNSIVSFDVLKAWFRYKNVSVDLDSRTQIIEKFLEKTSPRDFQKAHLTPPVSSGESTNISSFGF